MANYFEQFDNDTQGGASAPSQPQQSGDNYFAMFDQKGNGHANNLGNIREGRNGFKSYASPAEGAIDQIKLLKSYPEKHGVDTLRGIIGVYAPAGDHNDPNHYAEVVAKQMGISPDQPLDMSNPFVSGSVSYHMARFEKGADKVPLTEAQFISLAGANPQTASSGQSYPPAGSSAANINKQLATNPDNPIQRQINSNIPEQTVVTQPVQPSENVTPEQTPVIPVQEDAMGKPINAAAPNQMTPNPDDVQALKATENPNERPDEFWGPLHNLGHDLFELPVTAPVTAFNAINNGVDFAMEKAAEFGHSMGMDKVGEFFGLEPYKGQLSMGKAELPDSLQAKTAPGEVAQQLGSFFLLPEAKFVEAAPQVLARAPWLAKGAEAVVNRSPANATMAAQDPENFGKNFAINSALEFAGAPISTKSSTTRFSERDLGSQYERTAEGDLTPESKVKFKRDVRVANAIMEMPEGSTKTDVLESVPGAEDFFKDNGITLPVEERNAFNKRVSKITRTGEDVASTTIKQKIMDWAVHHGIKLAVGAGAGYASDGITGSILGALGVEGARYGINRFSKSQSIREINQLQKAFNNNFQPTSLYRSAGSGLTNTGKIILTNQGGGE